MGKRGPAAKGEFIDKSAVLSTRISAELRSALEAAVAKSGLTLSREIEHRLRRSFDEDQKLEVAFGSERNFRLLQMVAMAMKLAWNPKNPDAEWIDDPVAFEMAKRTISSVLEAARPPGKTPKLDSFEELGTMLRPPQIWDEIQRADASLPISDTGGKRVANRIKAGLGDVASRPRIFRGTADEMRAEADRRPKTTDKPTKRKAR